mmetsp:Transcript_1847/g.3793  ORF Transcript_1847/g.3793 Transcript_1847/m.3793 type:complete len:121 (+) Transcript_1847:603-965(+)
MEADAETAAEAEAADDAGSSEGDIRNADVDLAPSVEAAEPAAAVAAAAAEANSSSGGDFRDPSFAQPLDDPLLYVPITPPEDEAPLTTPAASAPATTDATAVSLADNDDDLNDDDDLTLT